MLLIKLITGDLMAHPMFFMPPPAGAVPAAKPIEPPKEDGLSHLVWGVTDLALAGVAYYFSGSPVIATDHKTVTVLKGAALLLGGKAVLHGKDLAEQAYGRFKKDLVSIYKGVTDISAAWKFGGIGILAGALYGGLYAAAVGGLAGHFFGIEFFKHSSTTAPAAAPATDHAALLQALLGGQAPAGHPPAASPHGYDGLDALLRGMAGSSAAPGRMGGAIPLLDQDVVFDMSVVLNGVEQDHQFKNIWTALFARLYPSRAKDFTVYAKSAADAHKFRQDWDCGKPEGRINFSQELKNVLALALIKNTTLRMSISNLSPRELKTIEAQYTRLGIIGVGEMLTFLNMFFADSDVQDLLNDPNNLDVAAIIEKLDQFHL